MKNAQHWQNRYWQLREGKIDINHSKDISNWEQLVLEIQADAKGEPEPPKLEYPQPITNKQDAHVLMHVIGAGSNSDTWYKSISDAINAAKHLTLSTTQAVIITRPRVNIHL